MWTTARPQFSDTNPARRGLRLIQAGFCALFLIAAMIFGPGPSAGWAAISRPALTFADAGAQATLGAAYTRALANVLDVNTVTFDPAVYNRSGLMTTSPQTFIRAGGGYPQPWTRDASINSWNAGSLLEPKVAANTLWAAVVRQSNGQLIVQQDNQQWDQVIWATGAWNHYLVTGDRAFLDNAYQTTANTLTLRRGQNYNATYGLFQGPGMFNDGISGYPAPPADATESHGGFVGDYPATATMMTLSTNAIYYSAYRSAAQMASVLGRPASEVSALTSAADSLKAKINQYLWNAGRGTYAYFVHNGDSMSGTVDQTEEGTGLSLAILTGIADAGQAQSILRTTHLQPYGIVDTYPTFARYSADRPGRHNVSIWPMVAGYWADAAAQTGDQTRFASSLQTLARLANTSGGFYEVYNAQTGVPDGGWQTGGHWGGLADQTWSATAYLRMVHNDLFGLRFGVDGLSFQPTLPAGWGDVTLAGVPYRGATLTVALHGAGNVVSAFKLDGTSQAASLPATLTGAHTVDITLTGGAVTGALRGQESGRCVDVPGATQVNLTRVALWDCNNGGNQQWVTTAGRQLTVYGGKCLDVNGAGAADGTAVQIYDCNGGTNQQWTVSPDGSVVNVGSGKCLDATGHGTANGTLLAIWTCNGGANQRWVRS